GGFIGTRSRISGGVRGLRSCSARSAPPWPPLSRGFHLRRRRLRFMLRTGQSPPPQRGVVAPLRRRPLDRRREPRYQGPWLLPGRDSHPLAALRFTLGYVTRNSFLS